MSVSVFEHPYLSGLLGDAEIADLFSVTTEVDAMLAFEAALARAEADLGLIPVSAAEHIATVCGSFVPDIDALRAGTARDGVVVPDLVRQLRDAVGPEAGAHVHFGATSQDVIDTALMLRLKQGCLLLIGRLSVLEARLNDGDQEFGERRLMGHTRMQAALPIKVSDRISAWRDPLVRHRQRLESFAADGFAVQFGGAVGTLEKLSTKAAAIRLALAAELSLSDAPQWQSQRDRLVEFSGILAMISGSLGKIGQDIALLAQMGGEIALAGGGASSTMAHKQNPVAAEALVAIGRFNAVQASGMQQAMIHEQERSGAAWTLEWMILPGMVMATGAGLRLALELVGNIRSIGRDGD
ncbi:3-carboxy-cis,cis-muconate cycloisomerase [Neorhizobium alkalisoli]|uniref:3-carboxy-cis,cis-muconate cycloisomerase n=1 Tax=Neorhizobium alkalisoli TaxID=528178 RepID=A0A561R6S7_9HYPH|nr:3-carboxy-cis,cis-muconate cycloisomerase [Neorhizobium alkalisoli]TWF58319.1 3-carboxy-cis,cis-muconate cycloisomerase [Neorhizobium alkalisoli]